MIDGNNLPLIPQSWQWTKFSNIFDIGQGGTPKTSEKDYWSGTIPWLRSGEIRFNRIKESKESISELGLQNSPARLLPKGTVMLAMTGQGLTRGRAAILDIEASGNQSCAHMIPSKNTVISEYLFYFLWAEYWTVRRFDKGSNQPGLNTAIIKEFTLPLPPHPEQHRIIAKIEELFTQLDAGVASLKKAQAQLRRYRQAVLKAAFEGRLTQEWREEHKGEIEPANLRIFGIEQTSLKERKQTKSVLLEPIDEKDKENLPESWEISRIGKVVRIIDYRGRTPPYCETGIPHLRSQNIKNGKIVWQNLAFVSDETYNQYMTRGLPLKGDILMTTEAPLGEVALAPEQKFSIAQRIILLRPFENFLSPKFLMYQIKSDFFQNQLNRKGTGTTVTGVSSRNFQPILVKIPSLVEQNQIVDEIERCFSIVDEADKTITTSLRQSESLRQSILKRAFEGKLVPQDPADEPASVLLERIKAEKARQQTTTKTPKTPKRKTKHAP
ncbi:MAG: hypothetical protein GYA23_02900 [Methanomicrobiales archaeon]|nr:hypothetical protein [Methanomicrobiales archaeon]